MHRSIVLSPLVLLSYILFVVDNKAEHCCVGTRTFVTFLKLCRWYHIRFVNVKHISVQSMLILSSQLGPFSRMTTADLAACQFAVYTCCKMEQKLQRIRINAHQINTDCLFSFIKYIDTVKRCS